MVDGKKTPPDNATLYRESKDIRKSVKQKSEFPSGQAKPRQELANQSSNRENKTVFQAARSSEKVKQNMDMKKDNPSKNPSASNPQAGGKKAKQQKNSPYAPALTQIHKSILKQDNSQGFVKAKHAADKALANNKIVLNRRFVLESTLGAGGMGTVYKAKDLRKIEANDQNPYVAIKVLNEDFKNHPDAFVTLQRETSRSHRLSHPKIVTVHDFDRDGDIIYMTMELLKGLPLDKVLRQVAGKGLSLEKALPIISDICDALAHAHEKSIIHSDLKPGNVFATKETTKVLDFGIARITAGNDSFDSGSLGALTPPYASLEMIEGQAPHPSDDLYAVALIAYELLSGHHPYDRLPANEASANGLTPKKLPQLDKRQWAALDKALQIPRNKRSSSIQEFQKAFFEKKKFPLFKVASALLLCTVGFLTYITLFVVDDVGDRTKQLLSSAQSCMEEKNYTCAQESYQAVLRLQPDNKQAKTLYQEAKNLYTTQRFNNLLSEVDECLNAKKDVFCAIGKKKEAEALSLNAQEIEKFNVKINRYQTNEKVNKLLQTASNCLNNGQFDCVYQSTKKALALDSKNESASKLKQKAEIAQSKQLEQSKAAQSKYISYLNKGKHCLKNEDFECSIRHFKSALSAVEKGEARRLLQQAQFSLQNKEIAYSKAIKLADKAESCFEKKNFSCAISSAESSLEFVSNYQRAIVIKAEAETAQQKAKSAFIIE